MILSCVLKVGFRCPSWVTVTEEYWTETNNEHVFPTHVFQSQMSMMNWWLAVPRKSFVLLWTCAGCFIIYGFGFQSLHAWLQYNRWFIIASSTETQQRRNLQLMLSVVSNAKHDKGGPLSSHCFTFTVNHFYTALQLIMRCSLAGVVYVCMRSILARQHTQKHWWDLPRPCIASIWECGYYIGSIRVSWHDTNSSAVQDTNTFSRIWVEWMGSLQ